MLRTLQLSNIVQLSEIRIPPKIYKADRNGSKMRGLVDLRRHDRHKARREMTGLCMVCKQRNSLVCMEQSKLQLKRHSFNAWLLDQSNIQPDSFVASFEIHTLFARILIANYLESIRNHKGRI